MEKKQERNCILNHGSYSDAKVHFYGSGGKSIQAGGGQSVTVAGADVQSAWIPLVGRPGVIPQRLPRSASDNTRRRRDTDRICRRHHVRLGHQLGREARVAGVGVSPGNRLSGCCTSPGRDDRASASGYGVARRGGRPTL